MMIRIATDIASLAAGALFSTAQYWLANRIFYGHKQHLSAFYILQRILLSFVFMIAVMVVSLELLPYAAIGMVATALVLSLINMRKR
jgi:hypothetical protein